MRSLVSSGRPMSLAISVRHRRHRAGLLEAAAFNIHHAADVVIAGGAGARRQAEDALVAVGVDDAQDLTRNEVEPRRLMRSHSSRPRKLARGRSHRQAARLLRFMVPGAIGAKIMPRRGDHSARATGGSPACHHRSGRCQRTTSPLPCESLVKPLEPQSAQRLGILPFRLDVLAGHLKAPSH